MGQGQTQTPISRPFCLCCITKQWNGTILQILQLKTSNTSIDEFKYLPVLTQFQLQFSLSSTQSQLNSTSTQTTELGTTQLILYGQKLPFFVCQHIWPCSKSTPVIWYGPYCIIGWVENWKNHIFKGADSNYYGTSYMF